MPYLAQMARTIRYCTAVAALLITLTSRGQQLQRYFDSANKVKYSSVDSLCRYARLAKDLADHGAAPDARLEAGYFCADCMLFQAKMDSAGALIDASLSMIKDPKKQSRLYESLCQLKLSLLIRTERYKDAVAGSLQDLVFAESIGDTLYQVVFANFVGQAHMRLVQKQDALTWYRKGLAATADTNVFRQFPFIYSNLGIVFATMGEWDSAMYYSSRAIAIGRDSQNLVALTGVLPALGAIYMETGRQSLAAVPFQECLDAATRLDDPYMKIAALVGSAAYHRSLEKYPISIAECQEAVGIIRDYRLRSQLPYVFMTLAEDYKAQGDYKDYAAALENYHDTKDSAAKVNSAAAIEDLQLKYESQRKENTILRQQFELKRKNFWILGGFILCAIIVAFSLILFRVVRGRQRLKMEMMQKEEQFKSEQAVKDAEDRERQRVAAELHDDLGTRINILSHAASRLMEVSPDLGRPFKETSGELMQSLRETVWTLKQEEIHTSDVWFRFKNFVSKLRDTYSLIQFIVREEECAEKSLHYNEALNLIRILQEAAGNAVRHSGCTELQCEKVCSDGAILFRIVDNGKGFTPAEEERAEGNGLANMRRRARESGFELLVTTSPAKGTAIELNISKWTIPAIT
jgi:signal transduction histidine kinase